MTVSAIKVSAVLLTALALLLMNNEGQSVHPKGIQIGPTDIFLTRDNPVKNPFPVSTPKWDREDRG